jgi:hypothetical protein
VKFLVKCVLSVKKVRVFVEMAFELRLHSPAGAEAVVYQWPLTFGTGSVSSWLTVLTVGSPTNAKENRGQRIGANARISTSVRNISVIMYKFTRNCSSIRYKGVNKSM